MLLTQIINNVCNIEYWILNGTLSLGYLNATAVVWRSPPQNDTITWTVTSRKQGQWWRHNNEVMVEHKVCFMSISSYFLADERFFTRYESVWQMSTTTFTITSRNHHSDSLAPRRRVKSTTGTITSTRQVGQTTITRAMTMMTGTRDTPTSRVLDMVFFSSFLKIYRFYTNNYICEQGTTNSNTFHPLPHLKRETETYNVDCHRCLTTRAPTTPSLALDFP